MNVRGSLRGRVEGGSERGKRVVMRKVEGNLVARLGEGSLTSHVYFFFNFFAHN